MFKRGDRVSFIVPIGDVRVGEIATVQYVEPSDPSLPYRVQVEDRDARYCFWTHGDRIQLHSPATERPDAGATNPWEAEHDKVAAELARVEKERANVERHLASQLADTKTEALRISAENADLRLRVAWLERENVRLVGKAKGAR